MGYDDDCDTLPETLSSELLEAVEWLRGEGFLTGEQRPFASLLEEAKSER